MTNSESIELKSSDFINNDISYGETLRNKLIEKSRKCGGKGEVRVQILHSENDSHKIVRVLFCQKGGGVHTEINNKDFQTTKNWFNKQKNKVDGGCVFFGDLCTLIKGSLLSESLAEKDANFIFVSLRGDGDSSSSSTAENVFS
jgi:hypothetical protein